jgi:hypothetical protein
MTFELSSPAHDSSFPLAWPVMPGARGLLIVPQGAPRRSDRLAIYENADLPLADAVSGAAAKRCTPDLTRGERNRNPGNIERNDWALQGLAIDRSLDDEFCVFTDVLYGVRALATVLLAYQRVHGLKTVREIIRRWAVAKRTYGDSSASVCAARVGCGPDAELDLEHAAVLIALVRAIIQHENGRVACRGVIADAVRLALA